MVIALSVALMLFSISLVMNVFQFIKIKKIVKAPQPTQDAREILSDLLNGSTLVRVVRIAPESVFLRSPRE